MNLMIKICQVPVHGLPRFARTLFALRLESLYDIFSKSNPGGKPKDEEIFRKMAIE